MYIFKGEIKMYKREEGKREWRKRRDVGKGKREKKKWEEKGASSPHYRCSAGGGAWLTEACAVSVVNLCHPCIALQSHIIIVRLAMQ